MLKFCTEEQLQTTVRGSVKGIGIANRNNGQTAAVRRFAHVYNVRLSNDK